MNHPKRTKRAAHSWAPGGRGCFVVRADTDAAAAQHLLAIEEFLRSDHNHFGDILWLGAAPAPKAVPRLTVYRLPNTLPITDADGQYPPAWVFDRKPWRGESLSICLTLKALERSQGQYSFIEFPVERGLAFATLSEKKFGLAFRDSTIAVRICGDEKSLSDAPRTSTQMFADFDQVRKALEDADLVLAPSPKVWERYLALYAFSTPPQPLFEATNSFRWLKSVKRRRAFNKKAPLRRSLPEVTVVIPHFRLTSYLPATLDSVLASEGIRTRAIVIDDATPDEEHKRAFADIEKRYAPRGVTFLRNGLNRGLGATRNRGLAFVETEYVLFLDADDILVPTFLQRAATALERNPEFDVVVPPLAMFHDEQRALEGHFIDYAVFLGNAPNVGWLENQLAPAPCLFRRSVFTSLRYDEDLPAFEDWALALCLAIRGHRFLVTNQLQYFYRRREDSMFMALSLSQRSRLRTELQIRVGRETGAQVPSDVMHYLANELQNEPPNEPQNEPPNEPPVVNQQVLRYRIAERVCAPFHNTPIVRRAAVKVAAALGVNAEEGKLLRHTVADRLYVKLKHTPGIHGFVKGFFMTTR